MKKNLLIIIFLGLISLTLSSNYSIAQTEIVNASFENWKSEYNEQQEFLYEEPDDEWWGTLNKLRRLGPSAPVTTTKTTDAHSGLYAVRMETLPFGNDFVIPGMLITGVFKPEIYGFLEGRPFSGKPTRLKGFYKFNQVEGDSCSIYINLTKYYSNNDQKDTIAEGSLVIKDPSDVYKEFFINLNYKKENVTPDSIKIVFISSAGVRGLGSTVNAKIGNTMFIDDLSLEYPNTVEIPLMKEDLIKVEYSQLKEHLRVLLSQSIPDAVLLIYNIQGMVIQEFTFKEELDYQININFGKGVYFYRIVHYGFPIFSGKFSNY